MIPITNPASIARTIIISPAFLTPSGPELPMCLAIPGKVVEIFTHEGLHMARVQFGGVTREACLDYVPETQVGEYVLVHVGFAISRVDEEEARKTYAALAELDQLGELDAPFIHELANPGSSKS